MVKGHASPEVGVVVTTNDAEAQHPLRFCLLGPLLVLRGDTPVSVGGAQQRAILAFLLTQQEAVSVEQIADALWGERPPSGYAATIQAYVFRLRAALEPARVRGGPAAVLVTESSGYRLNVDSAAVDLAEFERLVESGESLVARGEPAEGAAHLSRALALWRGPVLADLADYDFAAHLGRRLEELRLRAIESRIDAELTLGHHASLIAELTSLADSHPTREHLQAQRILALYRTGRQSEALDAFREIRARMIEELGVEPGDELTRLHQSILNQDPGLQAQQPAGGSPPRLALLEPRPRSRRSTLKRLGVLLAVAALVLTAIVYAVRHSRSPSLAALPANSVARIDADGSLHDAVPVGVSPDGVAMAHGATWVASTGTDEVTKIDPNSDLVVQRTNVGNSPQALAVSDADLWVVNSGASTVSRVSLRTGHVVGPDIAVGNLPSAIAVGTSGVWVTNTGDGTVTRIDPTTGEPDDPIPVGLRPDGIAVTEDTVWVSNSGDGTVSPIDARSRLVGSSIPVGAGPAGIVVVDGAVWVANSLSQTASRIDPSRRRVTTIQVGDGPQAIARVGKTLWVSNEFDGTVMVIDPAKSQVVKQISTGASVRGLASDRGAVYVTTRSLGAPAHRGGTLRITTDHLPTEFGVDPSNADIAAYFTAFSLVYDGLVGVQRTGGAAGLTLVPDLAVDLPRPSPDGREYVFTLRRGIHYSNGTEVTPDDIRRGLQQELTLSGDVDRLANIVGAPACIRDKSVCDLSKGIEVNDSTFQIVFHLRRPDPDFLYRLTEPLFATPEGEPGVPAQTPRPATGPYMIGANSNKHRLTLVRNPHFHVWSVAAQPEGYPDKIEWTVDPDPDHAVRNVLAGNADADQRASYARDYPRLRESHPDRFGSSFEAWSVFLFLNTHIAPFDDRDVRRAINFAVDRDTIVDLVGGTSVASPTCQVLPPNFPGFKRYCPYTANHSKDEAYHGPDFARASALVKRSGTRGATVTVVSPWDDPTSLAVGHYVAHTLTRLGYRARFALNQDDNYFSGENPGQIGIELLAMDWPTPSTFLQYLRCSANSPGRYCNPFADRLFLRALKTQGTDQLTADRTWATLDRTLTDDAAWLSLFNRKSTIVLSDRVGNYLSNPKYGPLFGQMWVQGS